MILKQIHKLLFKQRHGYSENEENTAWLQSDPSNYEIITDGKGLVPKGMFTWPTPGYTKITSPFGNRTHPIYGGANFHRGTDVSAPVGANFVAMADGKIATATYNSSYGNMVMINHGNGIVTLYAHGSKILVKTNQTVKQGQPVLKVGSTGDSTGPHAHFEVRVNGKFTNPMNYFEIGGN